MAHSYSSNYPSGTSVSQEVKTFFEDFYQLSDTPGIDEQYAKAFVPDATFILGSKKAEGFNEILQVRQGMWTAVQARKHTPIQIYPFGSDAMDLMLRGKVEYKLKAGGTAQKDWAAHAILTKGDDGKLRFKFYQVYLDTA